MSASVYSIRQHRSVALIAMTYTGGNADDAVDKFRQELARDLQGGVCGGWDLNIGIDEQRIHQMDDR